METGLTCRPMDGVGNPLMGGDIPIRGASWPEAAGGIAPALAGAGFPVEGSTLDLVAAASRDAALADEGSSVADSVVVDS